MLPALALPECAASEPLTALLVSSSACALRCSKSVGAVRPRVLKAPRVTSYPVTPAEEVHSLRLAFSPVCSALCAKVPNLAISYCTYGSLRSVIVAVRPASLRWYALVLRAHSTHHHCSEMTNEQPLWSSVLRLLFAKPVLHTFQRRQRRRVVKNTAVLPRLQAGDPHPLVSVHAAPATATAAQVHELHLSALGALVCGGASGIASSLATERRSLPVAPGSSTCMHSGVCTIRRLQLLQR
jgi:hypothetical protein